MKITSKHTTTSRRDGFTIIELLMATMVMAIVLTAVTGLASAMSNANRETKNMSERQAEIRYTTMRLSELIRNASLIIPLTTPRAGFCAWTDSDEDGVPKCAELVYVEIDIPLASVDFTYPAGSAIKIQSVGASSIEILEFTNQADIASISDIENGDARAECQSLGISTFASIISECTDVEIFIDSNRKFTSLNFTVTEAEVDRQYEVAATRMCSVEHLLDGSWELGAGFDDDQ